MEVKLCETVTCALWPFRAGRHPYTKTRLQEAISQPRALEGTSRCPNRSSSGIGLQEASFEEGATKGTQVAQMPSPSRNGLRYASLREPWITLQFRMLEAERGDMFGVLAPSERNRSGRIGPRVLFAPLRTRAAHVVQFGSITIENPVLKTGPNLDRRYQTNRRESDVSGPSEWPENPTRCMVHDDCPMCGISPDRRRVDHGRGPGCATAGCETSTNRRVGPRVPASIATS